MADKLRERKAQELRVAFLKLWRAGVRKVPELALRLGVSERTVARRIEEHRKGRLEYLIGKVDPADVEDGATPTTVEDPDEPRGPRQLAPDPGVDFDHMSVARRIVVDDRMDARDRIRACQTLESRRQYDLTNKTSKGSVEWSEIVLADIPVEERARLFGLLAVQMQQARAPFLGQAETTPEQEAVFFAIGQQVHPDDAAAVLAALEPGRVAALELARALGAGRAAPAADVTPVDAQDYLDHVP